MIFHYIMLLHFAKFQLVFISSRNVEKWGRYQLRKWKNSMKRRPPSKKVRYRSYMSHTASINDIYTYKIDDNNQNLIIMSKIQIPVYLYLVELFGAYNPIWVSLPSFYVPMLRFLLVRVARCLIFFQVPRLQ
jgi:hypothetical protein